MAGQYGPYVRLWGIRPSQIPAEDTSPQDLKPLITPILNEGVSFVDKVLPTKTEVAEWRPKGSKTFPHSTAAVSLFERVVTADELARVAKENADVAPQAASRFRAETWTLRRSVHEDAAKAGTASWTEWVSGFKEGHAEVEVKFTPTVMGTALKRAWNCAGIEVVIGEDTWEDVTLKLEESVHKMPAPLNNRVFPVLQVTAAVRGRREFIVVQIAAVPETTGDEERRTDGALRGAYSSVEKFSFRGDGGEAAAAAAAAAGDVEWIMGTVSDARGVLPAWVQKMAVPGAIAKDVDMFLEWVDGERKTRQQQ